MARTLRRPEEKVSYISHPRFSLSDFAQKLNGGSDTKYREIPEPGFRFLPRLRSVVQTGSRAPVKGHTLIGRIVGPLNTMYFHAPNEYLTPSSLTPTLRKKVA